MEGKLRRLGEQEFLHRKVGRILQVLLRLLSCCELNLDFAASYPEAREKPEVPILCGFPSMCFTTFTQLVLLLGGYNPLQSPFPGILHPQSHPANRALAPLPSALWVGLSQSGHAAQAEAIRASQALSQEGGAAGS